MPASDGAADGACPLPLTCANPFGDVGDGGTELPFHETGREAVEVAGEMGGEAGRERVSCFASVRPGKTDLRNQNLFSEMASRGWARFMFSST